MAPSGPLGDLAGFLVDQLPALADWQRIEPEAMLARKTAKLGNVIACHLAFRLPLALPVNAYRIAYEGTHQIR